jgi:hypothetical protein
MMTSFVIGAKSQGYKHFKGKIPSVFQIQDWIEEAWDAGINSQGRAETGGIRMTRKYIGTLEASAMFRLLEIPYVAKGLPLSLTKILPDTRNQVTDDMCVYI